LFGTAAGGRPWPWDQPWSCCQEIREERPDGSLVVTYRVGRYEAIRSILHSWIPHISILDPDDFRKKFFEEVKGWVQNQQP
jgi:predicted DNA-binding transcriptional regulator YafY